jgi:hypothetical protein
LRQSRTLHTLTFGPISGVHFRYHVGHPDHLKVFANPVAADEWFKENDPEGAAFEYEVLE